MLTPLGGGMAVLIGLTLGLLGGGGSILTVPVLVYVLGVEAKPAIAMSLPVVGITSLVGATLQWRQGTIRLQTAITFGLFAMGGAFLGARLAAFLAGATQLVILAVVMSVVAAAMLRGSTPTSAVSLHARPTLLAAVAIGVGLLTGLVGIGGGFLVVPALVLLAGVPMREAVGTSLLVIAMNAASGFIGHMGEVSLDWSLLASFTLLTVLGAVAGTALAPKVPQHMLKRAFALLLLAMSAFVLYQNRSVFSSALSTTSAR
jgi:uncharacterized protein